MKKILQTIPVFIITIPLFLILHIEKEYQNLIVYKFVWKEIVELFTASFIITGIFFLLVRNLRKSAVYALPVILTFYFFCDLKDFLNDWNNKSVFSSYSFLLPLLVILLVALFVLITKSKSDFKRLFLFINILFIVFIFYEAGRMAIGGYSKQSQKSNAVSAANYFRCDSCVRPDIYYIVFDAYTSSGVLRSEFNYQNAQLDSFLSKKDFFSIKKSRSNYNLTPFSIGSTFNLEYLPSLDTEKEFFLNEYLPGVSTVFHSELVPMLKKEGYEIFNHSIFDLAGAPSTIPPFDVWELNLVYKRHNVIRKINADIGWKIRQRLNVKRKLNPGDNNDVAEYKIQRDKHVTNTLAKLFETIEAKRKSPAFIYGHVLLPHSPYTYDSAGNKLSLSGGIMTPQQKKAAYVNQVIYVNKIIQTLVQSIFDHSKNRFIIILQGDHGARYPIQENKKHLEFANLNTMYFYNKDYRTLHDSLTNVNTFRVIFNTFFHKNYPLLKDTSYFLQYK